MTQHQTEKIQLIHDFRGSLSTMVERTSQFISWFSGSKAEQKQEGTWETESTSHHQHNDLWASSSGSSHSIDPPSPFSLCKLRIYQWMKLCITSESSSPESLKKTSQTCLEMGLTNFLGFPGYNQD